MFFFFKKKGLIANYLTQTLIIIVIIIIISSNLIWDYFCKSIFTHGCHERYDWSQQAINGNQHHQIK